MTELADSVRRDTSLKVTFSEAERALIRRHARRQYLKPGTWTRKVLLEALEAETADPRRPVTMRISMTPDELAQVRAHASALKSHMGIWARETLLAAVERETEWEGDQEAD